MRTLAAASTAGSRVTFDGLLIQGRAVAIRGNSDETAPEQNREDPCPGSVEIRHCTLVPGWTLVLDCRPMRPAEPSLELYDVRARVRITHSIVGSIQISQDQVHGDPMPIETRTASWMPPARPARP